VTVRTHSVADVAEQIMGCSERWLIAQLRSGRFRGRKVGRYWRMTDEDVREAVDICANDSCRRVDGNSCAPASGLTATSRRKVLGA
jgi:hypothetical protein